MKKLIISSLSILSLVILTSVSSTPVTVAATPSVAPVEIPLAPYTNAPPLAQALFAPEKNVFMSASDNANITVLNPQNTSNIQIKEVIDNEVIRTELKATEACVDISGAAQPRIKDLSVSGDGSTIIFSSRSNVYTCLKNLVYDDAGGVDGTWRVFKLTKENNQWVLNIVSTSSDNTIGTGQKGSVNFDGTKILFQSNDPTLWPEGDYNRGNDLFVKDTLTNKTTLVSLGSGGWQSGATINKFQISPNGKYVVWNSSFTPAETQVHPDALNKVSDIIIADIDPNNDNIIDENNVNITHIPHPAILDNATANKTSTLVGIITYKNQPHVLFYTRSNPTATTGTGYLFNISTGEIYSAPFQGTLKISNDGKALTDGKRAYLIEKEESGFGVVFATLPNNTSTLVDYFATKDRVFTSFSNASYESSINFKAAGGSVSVTPIRSQHFNWLEANPVNTLAPERLNSINEQLVWLKALDVQTTNTLQNLKYLRGDVGVKKPTRVPDESKLPANQKTNVNDISSLEELKGKIDEVMPIVEKVKEHQDQLTATIVCGTRIGQWCESARAALASSVSSEIVGLFTEKVLKKNPYILAFDMAYDTMNGECASPISQIADYAGAKGAKTYIDATKSNGQASSWFVTQNILEDLYQIDRPGCWDQIGLDKDAIIAAADQVSSSLPERWSGVVQTVIAVENDVNSIRQDLGI